MTATLALLLVVAGQAPVPPSPPEGFLPNGEPLVVLKSAGEGKKRVLAFSPASVRLRGDGVTTTILDGDAQKSMEVGQGFLLTVTPTKEGGATIQADLQDVRFGGPMLADPAAKRSAEARYRERQSERVTVQLAREGGAAVPEISDSMVPLPAFIPSFPREPVGVGAVWEVRAFLPYSDSSTKSVMTYRLTRLDDEGGTVETTLRQDVSESTLAMPAGNGKTVRSLGTVVQGKAELCFSFREVFCGTSSSSTEMTGSLRIDEKETRQMRMKYLLRLSVKPLAAAQAETAGTERD